MQETIHGGWGHKRVGHSFVIKTTMVYNGASCVAQMVKNLPAMQETQVRSLDWEGPHGNPLQYSGGFGKVPMATHSNTLGDSMDRGPGRLQSIQSQRVGHDYVTNFHFSLSPFKHGC